MNFHQFNYYIEKRDAAIIMAALDLYRDYLENDDHAPNMDKLPYNIDDVSNLFDSFDKSFKQKHGYSGLS